MLAGMGATTVHLGLMALKKSFGLLPTFEPYEDLQRLLQTATAGALQVPGWLLAYLNGAVILGFIFGKVFPYLPAGGWLHRGVAFGFLAWLCMGLGFLPANGRGFFGLALGLGAGPAALMLGMLTIYAISMSFFYEVLASRPNASNPPRARRAP